MKEFLVRRPYVAYLLLDSDHVGRSLDVLRAAGTLLAFEISSNLELDDLRRRASFLRAEFPTLVFIGRIREPVSEEILHVVRRATREVRAFVHDREQLEPTLRRLLTLPPNLSEDLTNWLETVKNPVPEILSMVRELFRHAGRHHEVGQLASFAGHSPEWLRRSLHEAHLPPPRQWVVLARTLPDALRLQADPDARIATFAVDHGYYDQPQITHAFSEAFGYTPAQVQRRLGWEWLVHGWLERHRSVDLG